MEICGSMQQNQQLALKVVDNLQREESLNITFHFHLHNGEVTYGQTERIQKTFTYSINVSTNQIGAHVLEILLGPSQIPQSPFLIKVDSIACDEGSFTMATPQGKCVCRLDSIQVDGHCVLLSVLLPAIIVPIFAAVVLLCFLQYACKKTKINVCVIRSMELSFSNPPEVLGRGSFGMVLKANYCGINVAVKKAVPNQIAVPNRIQHDQYPECSISPSARQTDSWGAKRDNFRREIGVLGKLRHPNITTIIGAVVERGSEMIVMEFMELGSLHGLLHNETFPIERELAMQFLRDISQGMLFLHSFTPPICHADLKSSNVLISRGLKAKISDFGLTMTRGNSCQRIGTAAWMAPEILNGQIPSVKSDVYSFAVLMNELVSRQDPYFGENLSSVIPQVAQAFLEPAKRPVISSDCPELLKDLICSCWSGDASRRPPFVSILSQLQAFDPSLIPGVESISTELNRRNAARQVVNDVFPAHIAEALLQGKQVEPEKLEMVSIFFSDIVSYTTLCSSLEADKVSNMLDRLYTKFDTLSSIHGVTKIDTIGDAYLATTNLLRNQNCDHVARLARFAMDAVAAAEETLIDDKDPSKGNVAIRVGFHCGPVVASVVGSKTKKFVLLGDSVNIASRMESTSKPGHIQCSKDAAQLLVKQDDTIPVRLRGLIQVKGKGELETYWVGRSRSLEIAKDLFTSLSTTACSAFNSPYSGSRVWFPIEASERTLDVNSGSVNGTNLSSGPANLGPALARQQILTADLLNYVQPSQIDVCSPLPNQDMGL